MQTFDDYDILALMWLGLVFLVGFVATMVSSAIERLRQRRKPMATFKKGNRNVR